MRCPDCRHAIAPLRWIRLPDELVCYSCGAALVRDEKTTMRDGLLIWLVLMLPATLLPLIGGLFGLAVAVILAMLVIPRRPWDGLRYTLRASERRELPPARLIESANAPGAPDRGDTPDRGEDPQGPTPAPSPESSDQEPELP